jgi:hypothetical protein
LNDKLAHICHFSWGYPEREGKQIARLVRRGADPNVIIEAHWFDIPEYPRCHHFSALGLACLKNDLYRVTVLLENGADPDLQMAPFGMTALHLCLASNVIQLNPFISSEIPIPVSLPPFRIACLLASQGARTDIVDHKGRTAFDMPAKSPYDDEDRQRWTSLAEQYRLNQSIRPSGASRQKRRL